VSRENLVSNLIQWRRDLHKFPETGFLEMRTASIVAATLEKLGFSLQLGKKVMDENYCMGKPSDAETMEHFEWAKENDISSKYLECFKEGYTGIVATWDTGRKGPTIAFRFDMDALDIHENEDENHFPQKEGFRSRILNKMHACGHDAHIAIGLGLAMMITQNQQKMNGTIKLIFQPAEEGVRGAKSMVKANVVKDVDYFIAIHIGTGVPHRHFVASNNGFFATSKLDITFHGEASHAGAKPEKGRNALLAAATAALNIYAISRHSGGMTRVNVGEMHAGSGRNIIPDRALLKVETRGETSKINEYVKQQVEAIVEGAAKMYQNEYEIKLVGEAISCTGSTELAEILHTCAKEHHFIEMSYLQSKDSAGSEDATYFMKEVQRNGGQATYCIIGTELAAGHHNDKFDINEESLLPAVEILYNSILKLNELNSNVN
jgi:aminobenzoyl-glutamate utilization protein A